MPNADNWQVKWDWIKKNCFNKQIGARLYFIGFAFVLVNLLKGHSYLLFNPPDLKTLADLQAILSTPMNIQVLIFACIYALCGILFFLVRLPFLNIEQFKFFGFEYKVQVEKQEALANETVENQRLSELARLHILQYIYEPDTQLKIASFINDDSFEPDDAMIMLGEILTNFYSNMTDMQEMNIETGYVEVENGEIVENDELGIEIKDALKSALQSQQFSVSQNKFSIVAVPLYWRKDLALIFYLRVYSGYMILSEADCQLIQIAWSIISDSAYIAHYRRELDNFRDKMV